MVFLLKFDVQGQTVRDVECTVRLGGVEHSRLRQQSRMGESLARCGVRREVFAWAEPCPPSLGYPVHHPERGGE